MTAYGGNSVDTFIRDPETGKLSFQQMVRNNVTGAGGLIRPRDVFVVERAGLDPVALIASEGRAARYGGVLTVDLDVSAPPMNQSIVTYNGVETVTVNLAGSGNDILTLAGGIAATTLNIYTGQGNDTVTVNGQAKGTTNIYPGQGYNAIVVDSDTSGTPASRLTLVIDGDKLAGGKTITSGVGVGNTLHYVKTGANTDTIFNGSDGADTAEVLLTGLPSGSTLKLDGKGQLANTSDTVFFDPDGNLTTPSKVNPFSTSGTIAANGHGTVTYTGFENVVLAGPPTATINPVFTINEGQAVTFTGTVNYQEGTHGAYTVQAGEFVFDVNGDSITSDLIGDEGLVTGRGTITVDGKSIVTSGTTAVAGTLSWAQLVELGIGRHGTYEVTALVDNDWIRNGTTTTYTNQLTTTLVVNHVAPTISVTGAAKASASVPYTLNFGAVQHGGAELVGWTVDWGDGTTDEIAPTATAATHLFQSLGMFDVRLGLFDTNNDAEFLPDGVALQDKGSAYAADPVKVKVGAVAASIGIDPATIATGGTVTLKATAPGPGITNYGWDINGDGTIDINTGNVASVTRTWAQLQAIANAPITDAGTYSPRVTVTWEGGGATVTSPAKGGQLVVTNTAPSVTATVNNTGTNTATINQGQTASLKIVPTSPAKAVTDAKFTIDIDWNDDGVIDLTQKGVSSLTTTIPATHIQDPGKHVVSGFVTDKHGAKTAFETTVTVNAIPQTLVVTGAATVNEGSVYSLNLNASHPGPQTVQRWIVDWNDGQVETYTGKALTLSHIYTSAGARTIGLAAIDQVGTTTATKSLTVNAAPASLVLSAPQTVARQVDALLTGEIVTPGAGNTFTVAIDWRDGGPLDQLTLAVGETQFSASHRYATEGTRDVIVTAKNQFGVDVPAASKSITVVNGAPVFSLLSASAKHIAEGEALFVQGKVSDADATDVLDVSIDWGDGTVSAPAIDAATGAFTIAHVYKDNPGGAASGPFTISAVASDNHGAASAPSTLTVTVDSQAPVVTGISLRDTDGTVLPARTSTENDIVTLVGTFSDAGDNDGPFSASINWGDGTVTAAIVDEATRSFAGTHRYLDNPGKTAEAGAGSYTIVTTVADKDGATGSSQTRITVLNAPPVVAPVLTLDRESIVEGDTLTVSGGFTDIGSLDTHTATIDWGDGSSSAAAVAPDGTFTASHVYTRSSEGQLGGRHTILATLIDDDGGSSTATASVLVANRAATIEALTLGEATVTEGGVVVLSGTLSDAGLDDKHTVSVNWGDGTVTAAIVTQASGSATFTAEHAYADTRRGRPAVRSRSAPPSPTTKAPPAPPHPST